MSDSQDVSHLDRPSYIVVEGPIGVGKTSLAKRLAESFDSDLVLENPSENPFLEQFYRNPRTAALPTQLFFLFQRARQIEEIRQSDLFSPVRIADFLLEKDRLFAELNLDSKELTIYEQVYRTLDLDPPIPDLVIYLQTPADVLMHRMVGRQRRFGGELPATVWGYPRTPSGSRHHNIQRSGILSLYLKRDFVSRRVFSDHALEVGIGVN